MNARTRSQLHADGVRRTISPSGGLSPQGSCLVERMGNHRKPTGMRSPMNTKTRDRK